MQEFLTQAEAYWDSRRAGRLMPSRHDLDPILDVPRLLPWMILADVFYDPLDFRYRLIGTRVVERSRANYTWKRFSELPHAGPDSQIWRDRAAVVQSRAPLLCGPPYTGGNSGVTGVKGIHLPLSEDGHSVNLIMTVVSYSP